MAKQELIHRLLRFAVVGVVVMGVFMGLNKLFSYWWTEHIAFLAAYPPAVTLHFCLNKWWTFGCTRVDMHRQIGEYFGMVVITFVVQYAFFWLAHSVFGLAGWLAAGVANGAQMVLSFLLMQRRVFGRSVDAGAD